MSKLEKIIRSKEQKCFVFKPNKALYDELQINQKRFAMIFRGEVDPTIVEAKAIANYFEFDIMELF